MKPRATKPDAQNDKSTSRSSKPASRTGKSRRTSSREGSPYAESIAEACQSANRLNSFAEAIQAAALTEMFAGSDQLTVFAPTDKAFGSMAEDERTALFNDPERLADLLRHHVVPGRVKAPTEGNARQVTPQFGEELVLTSTEGVYHVNGARIVKTNIRATNGVIHAINKVLLPA